MKSTDTPMLSAKTDVVYFGVNPGERVRIIDGPLAGVEGAAIERRDAGKMLVQVHRGAFLEVHELLLRTLE